MEKEKLMERLPLHCDPTHEVWDFLTEEQKKKILVLKLDMKIQWLKKKITDMENGIELKKKAIDSLRRTQEMLEESK